MNNCGRLINDIDKAIGNWDERSMMTVGGVNGLSMSDIEMLRLYADKHRITGSFKGLMAPMGNIKAVLDSYKIYDSLSFAL